VQLAADPMQALDGADALLLVTEWKCFQNPDFLGMRERMKHAVVFDGRNVYDPATLQDMGVAYVGIGRRNALGQALMQKGPQGVHPAALSWPVSAQARDEMVTHLVGT